MLNEMKHWPEYTTPNEKPYTLKHVQLLEETLAVCKRFRTAVQAGGSIGYWPRRMAEKFDRVITFEPEPLMRECLVKNLAGLANVEVRAEALGAAADRCSIELRGFGSHRLIEGDDVEVVTIDGLGITDLDLLQLDIEGSEIHALKGGVETIRRCKPIIQVEVLEWRRAAIWEFMTSAGYRKVKSLGRDYVFIFDR